MNPQDPFYSIKYDNPVDTNYGIPIFWHYDNAELSGKEEFKVIYKKIDEALKNTDPRYHILSLSVYGDFSLLGDVKDLFKDWPCKVMAKHIPRRHPYCYEKECDAARPRKTKDPDPPSNMAVAEDIHLFTQRNDPPCNILLINSDPDFDDLIKELAAAGYTVLLASYDDADPSLGKYAYFKWFWRLMRRGDGPLHYHRPAAVYFK
uniref:Uncharacterized protein n=1 Tax=Noccaea caerulescens TaxID=107243 RepID=A0A1J3JPF1_NOCCA